jgi:hypothetical protein
MVVTILCSTSAMVSVFLMKRNRDVKTAPFTLITTSECSKKVCIKMVFKRDYLRLKLQKQRKWMIRIEIKNIALYLFRPSRCVTVL